VDLNPGEIYTAFDPSGGKRPFVVVSRRELNKGDYFIAVPLTTQNIEARKKLPNCVHFPAHAHGLPKECVAQADALTLLRKADLATPIEHLGTLSPASLNAVIKAIGYVVGATFQKDVHS